MDDKSAESVSLVAEIPKALRQIPTDITEKILADIKFDGSTAIPELSFVQDLLASQSPEEEKNLSTYFRLAICIINFFSMEDPSQLHYQAAREILNDAGGSPLESDERARDLLARELVKECRELAGKIIPKELLQENVDDKLLAIISGQNSQKDHLSFCVSGRLWLDDCFITHISQIGPRGVEVAKSLSSSSEAWHKEYVADNNASGLFRFWVDKNKAPYCCRYLKALADILWNDRVKNLFDRVSKQLPAITQGVIISTIKPSLTKGSRIEVVDNAISCFSSEGREIATVPCVDPRLVPLICKGMEGLSTLNGHKLLRWQVRTGFHNWANGEEDPRLVCTTGGYEGIAEAIGCGNSKQSPTEVKAILHAQAYGRFQVPSGGEGNMIILREMERLRNGEPSMINIILGEMLLPNFGQNLPKGEARRLVPITELPPLIGSKNTHAAQAMLQLLILELFSKESDVLVQKNGIVITWEMWERLAEEARLPLSSLRRVVQGWVNGDLFTQPFLDRQGDEYNLGPTYAPVTRFLEHQGNRRIEGAKQGEKSAASRKALSEGKLLRKKGPKS